MVFQQASVGELRYLYTIGSESAAGNTKCWVPSLFFWLWFDSSHRFALHHDLHVCWLIIRYDRFELSIIKTH